MTRILEKPLKKTTNEVFASIDKGLNSGDYLISLHGRKRGQERKVNALHIVQALEVQNVGMSPKKINTLKACLVGTTAY